MNIENQVCSYELSRKLKNLGVKQDSIFYWFLGGICSREEFEKIDTAWRHPSAAFTVAELGEILPHDLIVEYKDFFGDIDEVSYRLMIQKTDPNDWNVYYYEKHEENCDFSDSNLANALAKMLIHLIENKLIDHFS